MIDLMRIFNSFVVVAIIALLFAILWIVIFSAVHCAMKLAIQEYWPEEKQNPIEKEKEVKF